MGEIILGVDPREKMASDYWTKGVHFENCHKMADRLPRSFQELDLLRERAETSFLLHKNCFNDLLNPYPNYFIPLKRDKEFSSRDYNAIYQNSFCSEMKRGGGEILKNPSSGKSNLLNICRKRKC